MNDWLLLALFCMLLNGVCMFVDRLLLHRHKFILHDWLYRLWYVLDETRVIDLHRLMASSTLALSGKLTGRRVCSVRGILSLSLVSACLTLIFTHLSYLYWIMSDPKAALITSRLGIESPFAGAIFLAWEFGRDHIPLIVVGNLPFDVATALVTIALLRKIRASSVLRAGLFIALDVIVAFAVAFACLCVCSQLIRFHPASASPGYLGRVLASIPRDVHRIFYGEDVYYRLFLLFCASTTLLPTVVYMGILGVVAAIKPLLLIGKHAAKHFCAAAVQDTDPRKVIVFTLLAGAFNVIALLIKTAAEVVKLFASAPPP